MGFSSPWRWDCENGEEKKKGLWCDLVRNKIGQIKSIYFICLYYGWHALWLWESERKERIILLFGEKKTVCFLRFSSFLTGSDLFSYPNNYGIFDGIEGLWNGNVIRNAKLICIGVALRKQFMCMKCFMASWKICISSHKKISNN